MNLYLRLLWLLWRLRSVTRRGLFDESRVAFRVWPTDCDLNLHMNNGRYLTFMDLGRTHLMVQAGLWPHVRRNRWMPVMAAVEITYIRSLKPFERFDLVSRIVTWNEKYAYMEQIFERNGERCAHAYVKGLFLGRKGRVSSADVVRAIGYDAAPPPLTDVLQHWAALTVSKQDNVKY